MLLLQHDLSEDNLRKNNTDLFLFKLILSTDREDVHTKQKRVENHRKDREAKPSNVK